MTKWLVEPTLDKTTNTVRWTIEARDGDEILVNSSAIILGKEGYERIIWATSLSNYSQFGSKLDEMLTAYQFNPGYRYSDYTSGDRLASYGVAGLVAVTTGGKLLKASGLIYLLKKFGIFIFSGLACVFYKIKDFFKR